MKGAFVDKMLAWHSDNLVAKLLDFHELANNFRIICDTMYDDVMNVNTDECTWFKFFTFVTGLNAFDDRDKTSNNTNKPSFLSYSLV